MKSVSIGCIGIGNVGSNLTNNLLKSNNNVFVYDNNNQSYSRLKNLRNEPFKTLLTAFGEGKQVIIISLFSVNSFKVLQGVFFRFFNLE